MNKRDYIGLFFVAPALLILSMFLIFPFIVTIYYSFTDYYVLTPQSREFIGLGNYFQIFNDPVFREALFNTFYFTVFVVPLQVLMAFTTALLINNVYKLNVLKGYYKIAYFAPVVMSHVVMALLWTILLSETGLINELLQAVGFAKQPFLDSPDQALNSIVMISAWHGMGYQMIIFLAGLQGISKSQYEAAELDNAGAFSKFINVTLPGIRPVLILIVLTVTIGATKLIIQPMIMTGGGPGHSTYTMVYYIFDTGNNFRQIGLASAIAVIFAIIVIIISVVQRKVTGDE